MATTKDSRQQAPKTASDIISERRNRINRAHSMADEALGNDKADAVNRITSSALESRLREGATTPASTGPEDAKKRKGRRP